MIKLSLTYKSAYGNDRYYPACHDSETICRLGGFKSFTAEQLAVMKHAEWELDIKGIIPSV